MKLTKIRNLVVLLIVGFFTHVAVAQDSAPMNALKQIADIVSSMNHFPSDDDKTTLAGIVANEELPQGLRDMAATITNIEHQPDDDGKAAMARIQASEEATDRTKTLAGMIASFNHMLNDEQKATLAGLFP